MSVQREHSKDLMAFRCLLHAHQRYDCYHMHNMSFEFYRARHPCNCSACVLYVQSCIQGTAPACAPRLACLQ